MWFNDEEMSRRGKFKGKRTLSRNPILNVNVRLSDRRRARAYRVIIIVLVPLLIGAVVFLLRFGLRMTGGLLFSRNDRFTITNLDIKGGAAINSDLIREYTQISEGMNLFGFNIRKVREKFLRSAPNARSMEIVRVLPDTLRIEVVERVPLARIGRRECLVVDSAGCVFGLRSRLYELPVITGYGNRNLRPGDRVDGMALAAIEVLEVCENPGIGLPVAGIDVRNRDYLVVRLPDGKSGRLSWEGMGEKASESREKLIAKLRKWVWALKTEKGKQSSEFDLTFPGRIYSR